MKLLIFQVCNEEIAQQGILEHFDRNPKVCDLDQRKGVGKFSKEINVGTDYSVFYLSQVRGLTLGFRRFPDL